MTGMAVGKQIELAQEFVPEAPRPLVRELPPADPFPVDALGEALAPAAEAINDYTQAPMAICGQSVLAAATLAAQGHADVQLPTAQARPLSCYFLTVAESGERKSACDSRALAPIRQREEELRLQYDADLPTYMNARDAWNKQREQILGDKKKYADMEAKRRALDDLGDAPNAPLMPILTCPEPTFEGLCKLLAEGQPSVGVFSSEGGQFIGGHGMSQDNKLKTASAMSSLWDGDPVRRVRAGDGVIMLNGRRVCLHLMAQPGVASLMLADRTLSDQGLLSRMLVTAPPSAVGTRKWRNPAPKSNLAIMSYQARLCSILGAEVTLAEGEQNALSPRKLPLSREAMKMWIGYADHVEEAMAAGGPLEPIRGLANKLPEHAGRLAAVLTIIHDIHAAEVSAHHMAAGIKLAQHYSAEARRLFDAGHIAEPLRLACRTLEWLRSDWPHPLVSLPDVYQFGPNAVRDSAKAKQVVGVLEDHGHLLRVQGGGAVGGQYRRDVWHIVKE